MIEPSPEVARQIADQVARVEAHITAACAEVGRARGSVRLLAVSKRQPEERVVAGYLAGLRTFGENYVQELAVHRGWLPDDVEWHLIGHLQSNKARRAAELARLIHTLDSAKLARALAGSAALVEVNVAGEASKDGVSIEAVPAVVDAAIEAGVHLQGFMCIPPAEGSPRPYFAQLRDLAERERTRTGLALPELSMGMSGDFADAIREGSTLVRVGSAIFGARL